MEKKDSTIAIIILGIVIIALIGYIFLNNHGGENSANKNFRNSPPFGNMQNFSLNDTDKNSTIQFFSNSPNINDSKTYCTENRANCFYYCREINSSNEICSQIMTPRGNFSQGGFRAHY